MALTSFGRPLAINVPVTIGRDDARTAAHQELSKSVYHHGGPSLLSRFFSWLAHLLGKLSHAGSLPGGLAGLALLAAVAVAFALGITLAVRPARSGRRPAGGAVFDSSPRDAGSYRRAAQSAAEAGDWQIAIREGFRGLMRGLEERGLLDERPGQTADEMAASAALALAQLRDRWPDAARTFDEVVYGDRPGSPSQYEMIRTLDEAARRQRPANSAAGRGA
jgi:hypothetical protein